MAHKVKVGLDNAGVPYANPDPCIICSACEIVWVAADGVQSFEVKFAGNNQPFPGTSYAGRPGMPAWSGACKARPAPKVRLSFKYTLTVNGISVDPTVDVEGGP